jgi:hypothetical protein
MKTFRVALTFFVLFAWSQANAVTVWYQPTPYPLKKINGNSMPQDLAVVHSWSGWLNNSFSTTLAQEDKLQIGGWGDYYASPIRFDLTGLPKTVDSAALYLWALPSGPAGPSQVSIWPITSDWSPSTIDWNSFPSTSSGYYWGVSSVVNMWRGYGITNWYNEWRAETRPNKGMMIWPYNSDGTQRFDKFVSSRSVDDGKRPILALTFTPTLELKMPLPGGARWLLTNEIGGYECMGEEPLPDVAHQGNSYFSLDFSPTNQKNAGGAYTGNIPILAAANGIVAYVESSSNVPNGFNIILNHNYLES